MYAGALRMDGPSLGNLELLSGTDGGAEGSLLARINTCISPGIPTQKSPFFMHDAQYTARKPVECNMLAVRHSFTTNLISPPISASMSGTSATCSCTLRQDSSRVSARRPLCRWQSERMVLQAAGGCCANGCAARCAPSQTSRSAWTPWTSCLHSLRCPVQFVAPSARLAISSALWAESGTLLPPLLPACLAGPLTRHSTGVHAHWAAEEACFNACAQHDRPQRHAEATGWDCMLRTVILKRCVIRAEPCNACSSAFVTSGLS